MKTLDNRATVAFPLLPAFLQSRLQNAPHVSKVFETLIDISETVLNQSLDTAARGCATRIISQQRFHIVQREAGRLSGSDESEFAERRVAVQAVVALATVFRFNQPDAFVVTDSRSRNVSGFGQLTGIFSTASSGVLD